MRSFVNIIISGGSFLALALNSGFVRLAPYKSSTQFISLYSHNPDCSFILIILKIYYYSLYHIFFASEETQAHLHGAAQAVIGVTGKSEPECRHERSSSDVLDIYNSMTLLSLRL